MITRLWRRARGPLAVVAGVPLALAVIAVALLVGALGALMLAGFLAGVL